MGAVIGRAALIESPAVWQIEDIDTGFVIVNVTGCIKLVLHVEFL
jgi:hypothetical protein